MQKRVIYYTINIFLELFNRGKKQVEQLIKERGR